MSHSVCGYRTVKEISGSAIRLRSSAALQSDVMDTELLSQSFSSNIFKLSIIEKPLQLNEQAKCHVCHFYSKRLLA